MPVRNTDILRERQQTIPAGHTVSELQPVLRQVGDLGILARAALRTARRAISPECVAFQRCDLRSGDR